MLRLAEGEIRSKDEQIALLHQMVAANEQEIHKKDARIEELSNQVASVQTELEQFKGLFNKYLARAEAARSSSAFTRLHNRSSNGGSCTADGAISSSPGSRLPPPSAAALAGVPNLSTHGDAASSLHSLNSSVAVSPNLRPTTDDELLPPPSSEDTTFFPPEGGEED